MGETLVADARGTEPAWVLSPNISQGRGVVRRFDVRGLKNATLRFYPDTSRDVDNVRIAVNSHYRYHKGESECAKGDRLHYVVENVTGAVNIAW